ncbi:MAG: hypothetical protein Ct9H300mP31_16980 [Acidimicrobiaceae bacterium]|nr:MAG: hypothetical protein Ct9H300mP31_16980 [Acidimicrobiaceae bacterium]
MVKVGRIAGQFPKPRSSDTETVDGVKLPSFRGHIVNDIGFRPTNGPPPPARLLLAYNRAAATLNLFGPSLRGVRLPLAGPPVEPEFVGDSPAGQRYENPLPTRSTGLFSSCRLSGSTVTPPADLRQVDFYTSHEALLLDYEEALTRFDSLTGDWYDCSAHMLWIGKGPASWTAPTWSFPRGVGNPLGCKLGPQCHPQRCAGPVPNPQPG